MRRRGSTQLAAGVPAYRDAWVIAHGHQPHVPTFCVHDRSWKDTPYCCDFVFVSENLAARVREVAGPDTCVVPSSTGGGGDP